MLGQDPHHKESSRISVSLAESLDRITLQRALPGDAGCVWRLLDSTRDKKLETRTYLAKMLVKGELASPKQHHCCHAASREVLVCLSNQM